MHSLGRLRKELREDFARYVALRSAAAGQPVDRVRVLLSSPGFVAVAIYRFKACLNALGGRSNNRAVLGLLKVCNWAGSSVCVFAMKTQFVSRGGIGPSLWLSNRGGIILGVLRLGAGCVIHHNVTIGMGRDRNVPQLGDRVWIGPNTVIYGGISVGNGTIIRGGSVVRRSVPAGCIVGGNPAVIEATNVDNTGFLSSPDPDYGEPSDNRRATKEGKVGGGSYHGHV